jgi:hypothetical protein
VDAFLCTVQLGLLICGFVWISVNDGLGI